MLHQCWRFVNVCNHRTEKMQFWGQGDTVGTSLSAISKDRGTVGADWFDVLMHCLMTGSSKSRMPLWCLSIGGHEKRHLAPELGVTAASGFKGSCWAGRWLHWCHIIHSAWPLFYLFIYFLESVPLPRQPALLSHTSRCWWATLCVITGRYI